jgi:hypothetical protein
VHCSAVTLTADLALQSDGMHALPPSATQLTPSCRVHCLAYL